MHCHGIVGAAVIAGNDEEIGMTEPVLIAGRGAQAKQAHPFVAFDWANRLDAMSGQLGYRVAGIETELETFQVGGSHHRAGNDLFSWTPTVLGEIVGDAADGVGRMPEIAPSIAIEVHRPVQEAARHELTEPHGAGKGTDRLQRIDPLRSGKEQEFFQFVLEIIGTARRVECQSGQRIDDPMAADIGSICRLDPKDTKNVLRRNTIPFTRPPKNRGMPPPKCHTPRDMEFVEELCPVAGPTTRSRTAPFGLLAQVIQSPFFTLCLREQSVEIVSGKTVTSFHLGDESLQGGVTCIIPGNRSRSVAAGEQEIPLLGRTASYRTAPLDYRLRCGTRDPGAALPARRSGCAAC